MKFNVKADDISDTISPEQMMLGMTGASSASTTVTGLGSMMNSVPSD
jgi:hypothetical protein